MKTRKTRSRCRRLRMSSQSRHSARTVRTKRSAIAFAFGARTGVFTIRSPSLRNTSSKGRCICCRGRGSGTHAPLGEVEAEVARLLSYPGTAGIGRAAGEAHTPSRVRDEEQDVVAAQEGALDGEEVAGDDACRLRRQEFGVCPILCVGRA